VQEGELGFVGPMEAFVAPKASNYYLARIFGEENIEPAANIAALTLLALLVGGMLL
jgi:ech hydrogenase subunit A